MMLARTPALQLVQTLQTILFSTASALGDDQLKLKRLYLSALATIAFVVIPAYCYACTHADLIINLLFGDKWQNAAGIFSALSIGMIALAISTLSSAILTATGGQKVVLYSQIACFAVMLIGVSQAAKISFVFVGLVVSVAYWLRLLMQLKAVAVKGGITASDFIVVLRGPSVVALLMAIPASLFVAEKSGVLQIEALVLLFKCIALLLLFKLFPRFFFCHALVDVLSKFGIGRRLVLALGD
jgi:O-antigen/teichoic acid export membrane protein